MTRTKTNLQINKRWLLVKTMRAFSLTILLVVISFSGGSSASAQFTFMGDYDKTFAAPRGYFADPQDPDPTIDEQATAFYTGDFAPDGSITGGGTLLTTSNTVDFYIRKFTPTGAADTSFGLNGVVRTNFHSRFDGVPGYDTPIVLKVQPDGKTLFAGSCRTLEPAPQTAAFGVDACVIRYNANGTLDQTFGGNLLVYTSQGTTQNQTTQIEPGKLIFQTGVISNGQSFGTQGTFHDIAIQPDGKIVLVGETRNYASFFAAQGYGAIVVRLNQNGTLDSTFGTNGIARWTAPQSGTCFPERRFFGVRLQADGRIIAVGHDGSASGEACFLGRFFAVTRWTANGQLETVRRLDNNTDVGQNERAVSAHFTRDGSKILVSGSYRNLSGTPAGRNKPTIIRLNTSDLSLDASFGSGGIVQSNNVGNSWVGATLNIKAIQPDGKIIAVDNASINGTGVVRLNPDGSGDNSFGNTFYDQQNQNNRGRIRVFVTNFNGVSADLTAEQILVRPNGRINLLGYSAAHAGQGILRAAVSQQNTVFENGIYSDFTNDGRTDISVFRNGAWFYLDSTNNQSNGISFGQAGDKPVPADYDGDGRTDVAVFRNGIWYLQQSTKGFTGISFGTTGDLPRPGDFDGDGKADIAVFRPSNGVWYVLRSSDNQFYGTQFGQAGDVPLLVDFDADGKSDIAVYRAGIWYYIRSSDNGFRGIAFGASDDIPGQGYYDGDSQADIAVWRPSNGVWYRLNSSTGGGLVGQTFGQAGDRPVPGDYDNDGKNDLAVYRGGIWYVQRSSDNSFFGVAYGAATDVPVPSAYLP
ncbi:MAG: hypothetical protein LH472_06690 [Pyrinomonadaceae bacterium]|nr:hypothetical protein [Pyrinomonadaceae bacterium]